MANEDKATYLKWEYGGYSVWFNGQKVADKLSLEEAGELLDMLCYREGEPNV